jgi:class 3 adenylate cyclase/pimeloyl-ACP methyl ester carboxylesterase
MEAPETRFVTVGDADVAYQVVGDGPIDLLYCYGLGSHVEMFWDTPGASDLLPRLATFSRLIFFDRRGTGASDSVSLNSIPIWEEWTEDIAAVLKATESKGASILAATDAGPLAILFAAMHPEMVNTLILLNTSSRYLKADGYSIGASAEDIDALVETFATSWGTPELTRLLLPSMASDSESIRHLARVIRSSATPRTAAAQYGYMLRSLDVRSALPLIQVPTLVLHVRDSPFIPIEHGRYIAEHIHGSRFIELPGGDIGPNPGDSMIADEIAEFLTGERLVIEADRILTTVLFTDIVGSTAQAASLGDQRWRSLLDSHDSAVREQLRRFRGREINTTGDGFLASFDGPARAIRCSQHIVEATAKLGIELRVGLHTGECEVRGADLGGLAVHIAARVGALAEPGEVLVSATVKDLVIGSGIEFRDHGEDQLKGVPGTWKLFAVAA